MRANYRFLISGMPRCRTAWMTALFNALGARTFHDAELLAPGDWRSNNYGVIDPTAAMMLPLEGSFRKRFCVYSHSLNERLDAMDRWSGTPISEQTREVYRANYATYATFVPKENHFHVEQLNDRDFVADLFYRATGGLKPDEEVIDIFQLLKIEEHYPKAKALLDKRRG